MPYAAILVHARAAPEALPALKCARALAEMFNATLIGVAAEMIPPPPSDDGISSISGPWVVAMREISEANLVKAKTLFHEVASGLAKPTLWECGLQLPGPALAAAARGADLLVASGPTGKHQDPYSQISASDLAMTSGRPVLVTPADGAPFVGKKIVLAWKDTREARRAMADAMPFFQRADEVLVLEVCDERDGADAAIRTEDVVQALKRHGVVAQAKVAGHKPADGHEILRQAALFGADLIVAGAYGHTRLGEWAFGGVTHDLLTQHSLYVLLSH